MRLVEEVGVGAGELPLGSLSNRLPSIQPIVVQRGQADGGRNKTYGYQVLPPVRASVCKARQFAELVASWQPQFLKIGDVIVFILGMPRS